MSQIIGYFKSFPQKSVRVTESNIKKNDIITLQSKGITLYCIVLGTTPTMVKTKDLDLEVLEDKINIRIKERMNPVTKDLCGFSRKMFKIKNVVLC